MLPLKIAQYIAKKAIKNVDYSNPIVQDNLHFVFSLAKEFIKPW